MYLDIVFLTFFYIALVDLPTGDNDLYCRIRQVLTKHEWICVIFFSNQVIKLRTN